MHVLGTRAGREPAQPRWKIRLPKPAEMGDGGGNTDCAGPASSKPQIVVDPDSDYFDEVCSAHISAIILWIFY